MDEQLKKAAEVIQNADTFFISAGAGIGVDSGLPDYRGNEGFWKAYPLLRDEQISFIDLANPSWFRNAPERAWGFYGHRFNLYNETVPHEGFDILRSWAKTKNVESFVYTSNVDGQFQKAGFSADHIYECHGSIHHFQCNRPCSFDIWPVDEVSIDIDVDHLRATGQLPICINCGAIARLNILMFGDWEWNPQRSQEQNERLTAWKIAHSEAKIVTIELGAGKTIPTVRRASEAMKGTLIRINPRDSDGPDRTISISFPAKQALKALNTLVFL